MMLRVIKIIEGGIDLQSKEQLPRSLVISNGVTEAAIPVSDSDIEKVIELYVESEGIPQPVVSPSSVERRLPSSPTPVRKAFETFEPEKPEMIEDAGFEPGEDCFDRGTGVESL